jgi:putative MFS transporter
VQASFGIAEETIGRVVAFARLGAIPAVFLALMADRIGRRRLLVTTLVGLSLFSMATGLATSASQFMLFQASARLFTTLEEILAVVFALEMLPARHRGWGVGFLAAMGGLGSGLASVLYGTVESLPGGWRALYVIGGMAILYVAWLRRKLPESPMFERQDTDLRASFFEPLREIFTRHRRALLALVVIAGTFWFQVGAALNFMSKFLQGTHGYSPGQVSLLFVIAGTLAIFGNVLAGRVSDRIGRRPTLAGGMVVNCIAFVAFYNIAGPLVPLAWIAALFSFFVVDVMVNAVSGELFPTSCRSTAATLRTIISLLAGAVGLVLEGSLYTLLGSHGAALSLMTLSSLLGLPAVALWLRETANTTLN